MNSYNVSEQFFNLKTIDVVKRKGPWIKSQKKLNDLDSISQFILVQ